MLQRRLGQLGLAAVLTLGVGTGMAFADAPASGGANSSMQTTTSESSQAISSSGDTNAQIAVEHHSDQSTGSSVADIAGGHDATSITSAHSNDVQSQQTTSSELKKDVDKSTTNINGNAPEISSNVDQVSLLSSRVGQPITPVNSRTYTVVGNPQGWYGAIGSAAPAAPQPLPIAPVSHKPGTPTEPLSGLFQGIQSLMSNVFVPVGTTAPSFAQLLYSTLPVLTILAIGLSLFVLSVSRPVHLYTARLRHGGFLGAPRSHVTATTFFFATPLKWAVSIGFTPV